MYTISTSFSPMDDSDLAHNFKNFRRKFWIRRGLWIPEDTICTFAKIRRSSKEVAKKEPHAMATVLDGGNKIILVPELAYFYCAAHTTLIHEMAHLYIGTLTNWDGRYFGHGKIFNEEIDRLYAIGAFRKLI